MKFATLTLFALLPFHAFAAGAATPARPNLVFLLSDDLGSADLGCYGSTFHETPHLDRLAREGVRFSTYYTAGSICSPTRASLMTGKYPVRTGITDWIPGMKPPANSRLAPARTKTVLAPAEFTLGRAFKEAGYQTFYTGKWHLGPTNTGLQAYGFDNYVGDTGAEEEEDAPARKRKSDGRLRERRESTGRFTRASLAFLEKRDVTKPFFLMLSYHDVHTPIQPMPGTAEHYRAKLATLPTAPNTIPEHGGLTRPRQDNADYASMVAAVDTSVAEIRTRLDALGLAKNTIIVFASDNGGLATQKKPGPTSNAPLRSGKGWLYEGGIRAPLIIHVPGGTTHGTVCATPVISTDLYPTFLELAGLPARPAQHVDGVSVAALLRNGPAPARPTLFWHYPHYHGSTWAPGAALRDGDWKLIEFYDPIATELYDLASDPGEARNLAPNNSAKLAELTAKLHAWQKSVGAVLPARNPAYSPAR